MYLLLNGNVDILQGVGANRDVVNGEAVPVVFSSTSVHPVVHESDALTLKIDGNLAASARVVIDLYIG